MCGTAAGREELLEGGKEGVLGRRAGFGAGARASLGEVERGFEGVRDQEATRGRVSDVVEEEGGGEEGEDSQGDGDEGSGSGNPRRQVLPRHWRPLRRTAIRELGTGGTGE